MVIVLIADIATADVVIGPDIDASRKSLGPDVPEPVRGQDKF